MEYDIAHSDASVCQQSICLSQSSCVLFFSVSHRWQMSEHLSLCTDEERNQRREERKRKYSLIGTAVEMISLMQTLESYFYY